MGTLYLVRHAQASLGADDYDRLSPLGHRQSERLGRHWAERARRFDEVITGELRRHAQTCDGIAQGLGQPLPARRVAGLNEYDSDALLEALQAHEPDAARLRPGDPEAYRHHFRRLRRALLGWMDGRLQPRGMPPFEAFRAGVMDALDALRTQALGRQVLVVSSGGPISVALGTLMGLTPEAMVELNMRIRNTAVTELQLTPRRLVVLGINQLAHLDRPEFTDWITYA